MIPSSELALRLVGLGIRIERSVGGGFDYVAPRGELTPPITALLRARADDLVEHFTDGSLSRSQGTRRWPSDIRGLCHALAAILVERGAPPVSAAEYAIAIVHGFAHEQVVSPFLCRALDLPSDRYIEVAQAHFGYPGFRSRADDMKVAKILIRSAAANVAKRLRAESKAVQS